MNSDEYTTYTLIRYGQTVSFQVYESHVIVDDGSFVNTHSPEGARKIWYNCVGQGYTLSNKSVVHDMDEFHKSCRDTEQGANYALEA